MLAASAQSVNAQTSKLLWPTPDPVSGGGDTGGGGTGGTGTTTTYRQQYPLPSLTAWTGLSVCSRFAGDPGTDLPLITGMGAKWIRNNVSWYGVEQVPNVYNFTAVDQLVNACTLNGVRVHINFDGGNALYTGSNSTLPSTSSQLTAFANFVKATVNRYKHLGIMWEGNNEPDLNVPLAQFVQINNTMTQAIRSVSSDEWIIGPVISSLARSSCTDYLTQCFQSGLLNNWDAVSVHPYVGANDPETNMPLFKWGQNLIAQYSGGRYIPILATEWGYDQVWTPLKLPPSNFQVGGINLLASPWTISATNWIGYWAKPAITYGVADPFGGHQATRLAAADYPSGAGYGYSGIAQVGTQIVGQYYTVSAWMRSEGQPFILWLGLEDSNCCSVMLDGSWRRFYATFQAKNAYGASRIFEAFERAVGNPAWDIYAPQVELVPNVTSTTIYNAKVKTIADFAPRMYKTCLDNGVPYLSVFSWREVPSYPGFGLINNLNQTTATYNAFKYAYQTNQP